MPDITTWSTRVRSTDMDADRVVNNAVYFQYFEQARLEHMATLGLVPRDPARDASGEPFHRSFTIAETGCKFRLPLRYRQWISVLCWTSTVSNRSFSLAYKIRLRNQPDTLVAEGSSAQVWLDDAGHPTLPPPAFREALERSAA